MFEARLKQASILRKLIESLKDLVKEGNFECTSNGISLQGVDPSFVALIQVTLRGEGFESFRVDRSMTLGLNINNMAQILKFDSGNDSLTLSAEDNADLLTFRFESPNGERSSQFNLKLMDIEMESFGIPMTVYKAVVRMPASEFQRITKDLSTIGETAKITVTKDGVRFSIVGNQGSGSVTCRPSSSTDDEDSSIQIKLKDIASIEQSFALRFLNIFAKASAVSDTVTLMLNDEVPLVAEYRIGELGHLRFFLAPKIEEEGEAKESEPVPAPKPVEKKAAATKKKEDPPLNVKSESMDDTLVKSEKEKEGELIVIRNDVKPSSRVVNTNDEEEVADESMDA